ncbi:MAG: alanine--tRNA ligase-related protein, partial [Burkholderiaceae bacterium]
MTAWLFREFPYQSLCEARVVAADARGIVLDCTIFYPHGGGQPGDTGTLVREDGTVLPVIDTLKGETRGEIVHVLPDGSLVPRVGETVSLALDWERR